MQLRQESNKQHDYANIFEKQCKNREFKCRVQGHVREYLQCCVGGLRAWQGSRWLQGMARRKTTCFF